MLYIFSIPFLLTALYLYLSDDQLKEAVKEFFLNIPTEKIYALFTISSVITLCFLFILLKDFQDFFVVGYHIGLGAFSLGVWLLINAIKDHPKHKDSESTIIKKCKNFSDNPQSPTCLEYEEFKVTGKKAREWETNEALLTIALGITIYAATLLVLTFSIIKPLIRNKHSHETIEKLLKKYFSNTLISSSLKEVMVTSYDVKNRAQFLFTRSSALHNPTTNFLMCEAARATSAAPTYFNPFTKRENVFVDGGIFANNPSMCAYADALKHTKKKDMFLVSLGTGIHKPKVENSFFNYGLLQWATRGRFIPTMMEASSDSVHFQMQNILGENYRRIQLALGKNIGLDNADPKTIEKLQMLGTQCINENSDLIDEICQRLLKDLEEDNHSESKQNAPPLQPDFHKALA